MWREVTVAEPRSKFLDYVPNQLLGQSVAQSCQHCLPFGRAFLLECPPNHSV